MQSDVELMQFGTLKIMLAQQLRTEADLQVSSSHQCEQFQDVLKWICEALGTWSRLRCSHCFITQLSYFSIPLIIILSFIPFPWRVCLP